MEQPTFKREDFLGKLIEWRSPNSRGRVVSVTGGKISVDFTGSKYLTGVYEFPEANFIDLWRTGRITIVEEKES